MKMFDTKDQTELELLKLELNSLSKQFDSIIKNIISLSQIS